MDQRSGEKLTPSRESLPHDGSRWTIHSPSQSRGNQHHGIGGSCRSQSSRKQYRVYGELREVILDSGGFPGGERRSFKVSAAASSVSPRVAAFATEHSGLERPISGSEGNAQPIRSTAQAATALAAKRQ